MPAAQSGGSERPRGLAALPAERGDTVLEIDPATVVVQSAARKLKLCTCTKTAWKCEDLGGVTHCFQECVEWECKEVPMPTTFG